MTVDLLGDVYISNSVSSGATPGASSSTRREVRRPRERLTDGFAIRDDIRQSSMALWPLVGLRIRSGRRVALLLAAAIGRLRHGRARAC